MSLQTRLEALVAAIGVDIKSLNTKVGGNTDYDLTQSFTNTQPAAPSTGVTIFARQRARNVLASVGPQGVDTRYQPALFSNNISYVRAIANSTTFTTQAIAAAVAQFSAATTAATVPNAVSVATTNLFTSLTRFRLNTSTAAGTIGRLSAPPQWLLSTTPNMGGFYFVARCGLQTTASGTRAFIGMSSNSSAYALSANPSTLLNQIGFYWDASQTTMRFISSGSVVGTPVDLGANFPVTVTPATYFYELSIFVPSGLGQYGLWSAHRINDGQYASGAFGVSGSSALTTVPLSSVLLGPIVSIGNGTLAATHSMDVQSMYIDSDN